MTRILIVEDNQQLARLLRNNLEFEGYEIDTAHSGAAGLVIARQCRPDLLILDLMLPDMDGYRVLRELREAGDYTPVLILTARAEESDKVLGFRSGADDYVTKPFGVMEFLARVAALIRRTHIVARESDRLSRGTVRFGDVVVSTTTHTVTRSGQVVLLRPKEYDLLYALVRRNAEVATREQLFDEVWGYTAEVVSRTLDTHIAELRRKLEVDPSNPEFILTVRGAGYRLLREW